MDFVRYMTRVYYICTIIVHYYNMKNNYSKRLMDVIEYSREEAARLQNSYIGPEHLMLGIIRDGEGKAVQALRELNVDEWDIKRKIEQEIKNTIDAEDAVLQLHGTNLSAGHIQNFDGRHCSSTPFLT